MTLTNFTNLTNPQKTTWSRDIWKTARAQSFIMQLAGTGPNSMIQRITELTKTEKGTQAMLTLVPDLAGDGAMGDTQLWDSEEAIAAYQQPITVDQIRNANRLKGKVEDQRTVINFRETSRDLLGYWLAARVDQLAFLTLSGIDYRMNLNGQVRTGFTCTGAGTFSRTAAAGMALYDLAFASSVTTPSTNRGKRWDGTNKVLKAADVTAITSFDVPSYAMLVQAKAFAKDLRLRSLNAGSGNQVYHVFMHPSAMARLKLDTDFKANLQYAAPRDLSNPLFSGALIMSDGLVLHESPFCYTTLSSQATTHPGWSDYKWGATAAQDGSRILFLGAQALAYADLGLPSWEEQTWDYQNQNGISIGKILGFLKPKWYSPRDAGATEDYGVMTIDVAI